jgi:hypothetical protein
MNVKIFYSWQTTTSTKYNKNFIMECILESTKQLNRKPGFENIEFEVLEGVRGEAGSPSVASKITDERIPSSDIFIADLSVINFLESAAREEIKIKYGHEIKPMQNNNVLNEHGVASNALGLTRLIGVLNRIHGSPNENPDNIPFDLRHLRFPIEYSYSVTDVSKDEAKKSLVSDLLNAIRLCTLDFLQFNRNKFLPFIGWTQWSKSFDNALEFVKNEKYQQILESIVDIIAEPNRSIRVLGLSGLGKTRMLFEIFKETRTGEPIQLANRILYINDNLNPGQDYSSLFGKIIDENSGYIVIVDNCSLPLHRRLMQYLKSPASKIVLITVDSNPEETFHDVMSNVSYITIKKEEQSTVVDNILSRDFSYVDSEKIAKIREFSQGIPLMAVLLAQSIKEEGAFHGTLEDKDLLDKLLGSKGREPKYRTILKSCALFNFFGYYDDLVSQLKFIATNKNITSISGDDQVLVNDFYETCDFYLKREIFEKRGRLIGMRPFPLAMSLAEEWLDSCSPQRFLELITEIGHLPQPDSSSLTNAFAEQMKYLGDNDKAVQIVERITGIGSPFDNAEVLNTELGSRLFRSFVEVNPVAIANSLSRTFARLNTTELLQISDGRRNLIWVFEKLCFDKRTFDKSVKILYALAVAENETWANNATGQFLQLFKVSLAGTEVNLSDRWDIIVWGLSQENEEFEKLAISAMSTGLSYGSFNRLVGAERQGTKVLEDYRPTGQEIAQYWKRIIDRLGEIALTDEKHATLATDIITNAVSAMYRYGLGHHIIELLNRISKKKNYDWDDVLNSLRFSINSESVILSDELLVKTNSLLELLTKTDFVSRYADLPNVLRYQKESEGEKYIPYIKEFVNDFVVLESSWSAILPDLYNKNLVYSVYFGTTLHQILSQKPALAKKFVELSIQALTNNVSESPNFAILGGFVSMMDDVQQNDFYEKVFQIEKLKPSLFVFIAGNPKGKLYLDMLFSIVDNAPKVVANFMSFDYNNALNSMTVSELILFATRLSGYGSDGLQISFILLYDSTSSDVKKRRDVLPLLKEFILALSKNLAQIKFFDDHRSVQTIIDILSQDGQTFFAKSLNKAILKSMKKTDSYWAEYNLQTIYEVMIKRYFGAIWPDLSKALLSKNTDYRLFYNLKNLLGSQIGGVYRKMGVLFYGDLENIFRWCEINRPTAPARLAEMVPIFADDNKNYEQWHPITLRLLQEFGNIKEVLDNLSSNMGSYSWVGSLVPLLGAKKTLFEKLLSHEVPAVKNWATMYIEYLERQIESEKNSDAESTAI